VFFKVRDKPGVGIADDDDDRILFRRRIVVGTKVYAPKGYGQGFTQRYNVIV